MRLYDADSPKTSTCDVVLIVELRKRLESKMPLSADEEDRDDT